MSDLKTKDGKNPTNDSEVSNNDEADDMNTDLNLIDNATESLMALARYSIQDIDDKITAFDQDYKGVPSDQREERRRQFIMHEVNNIVAYLSVGRDGIKNALAEKGLLKEGSVETLADKMVFVIDDDVPVAAALKRIVLSSFKNSHKPQIALFNSAKQAKEAIENGKTPDYIICDLMMPEMTGEMFWEWLKENHPELLDQIMFVSGGTFTDSTDEFIKTIRGKDILTEKPFDLEDIERRIKSALGQ